jgi:hypothetical protein
MTVYDVLLIIVVLSSLGGLVVAVVQAFNGNWRGAGETLKALAWGAGLYVATVCLVSLTTKQKVRGLGTPDCNDDWCVTPLSADEKDGTIRIEFKAWSRARRATQREFGVRPYLVDEAGERFDAYEASGPPFDQALQPNESFTTVRFYRVNRDAKRLDLVLRDGFGPDAFVIGASQSLLHKRTVYRIKPAL